MKKITFPGELIGQKIIVIKATNPSLIGIIGKVENETKETVLVDGRVLLKKAITIRLTTGEIVNGKDLAKRSEERIKNK